MSIQKIIQESIHGNPLEMKEALAEELRNRVAEAISAKMEEVEQIDELDKKTLVSYVKKAGGADRNSLAHNVKSQMTSAHMGDREEYKKSQRAANNRSTGIQRAADRLAK